MKNIFNSVKLQAPKRNYFDLTHDVKLSGRIGELIPVMLQDCIPGDHFNIGSDILVRFAPMMAPIMHRFDVTIHYFFCPNRLVWGNWEEFITSSYLTEGGADPVWPYITYDENSPPEFLRLADYLGLPTPVPGAAAEAVSILPFAIYNKIFAEYYRDQNLEPLVNGVDYPGTVVGDGNNDGNIAAWYMQNRAWEHDYFSSCLPWAQKGPEVVIPYNQAPIPVVINSANPTTLTGAPVSPNVPNDNIGASAIPADSLFINPSGVQESATAPLIEDLRRAFKIKEWLERNARGGTRYIEHILAHFGVRSSDKRLNRPEYICGLKAPVIVSEVLNTTGQTGGIPQGTMAGHGISASGGGVGSYFVEEHGYIMGIASVTPKPAYQQGIARHWSRETSDKYFWPTYAHLGEQAVLNKELYAFGTTPNETFGYIPIYSEYRYQQSRVSGQFRDTLNVWHAGRIFDSQPNLNADFVKVRPEDTSRIFAVTDPAEDNIFMHVLNRVSSKRPIPMYGTPGI